jgi:hypothetical protein
MNGSTSKSFDDELEGAFGLAVEPSVKPDPPPLLLLLELVPLAPPDDEAELRSEPSPSPRLPGGTAD